MEYDAFIEAQKHWDTLSEEEKAYRKSLFKDSTLYNQYIQNILSHESFLKEIEEAIESGKDTDWGFDGENEICYGIYDVFNAKRNILEVLKKYLIK